VVAIRTDAVKVEAGDVRLDAHLAMPTEPGPYPGAVVIQEVFGVNDHIRDVTQRVAREGYIAIAPAIYQRQAPGFEAGYSNEALELGRQYKNQTRAPELLNDIQSAINYIKGLPQCQRGGIGCMGFCFGGHVAYLAATLPEVKATASFYGAGIVNTTPGGGDPTITRTPEIQGTIYAFFGTEDPLISLEEVDRIEAELQKHQIPHRVVRYEGATHGFFCDQRDSYDPNAAADAWAQTKALFAQQLP